MIMWSLLSWTEMFVVNLIGILTNTSTADTLVYNQNFQNSYVKILIFREREEELQKLTKLSNFIQDLDINHRLAGGWFWRR